MPPGIFGSFLSLSFLELSDAWGFYTKKKELLFTLSTMCKLVMTMEDVRGGEGGGVGQMAGRMRARVFGVTMSSRYMRILPESSELDSRLLQPIAFGVSSDPNLHFRSGSLWGLFAMKRSKRDLEDEDDKATPGMGWLRLIGSLKLQVSFAKEPHKRDLYSKDERTQEWHSKMQ